MNSDADQSGCTILFSYIVGNQFGKQLGIVFRKWTFTYPVTYKFLP